MWQAAPWIAHRIGAKRAYAVEYDNVSCGTPVALRVARDMLLAEDDLRSVLVVAACRESYLLDYGNDSSRFMFNFGDGAVAGLLVKDGDRNEVLGSHGITDGSLAPGQGAERRQRVAERRLPLPGRGRAGRNERRPRPRQPRQLRRGRAGGRRGKRCDTGRRRLPLRDPHEAVDASGAAGRAGRSTRAAPPISTTRGT